MLKKDLRYKVDRLSNKQSILYIMYTSDYSSFHKLIQNNSKDTKKKKPSLHKTLQIVTHRLFKNNYEETKESYVNLF